MAVPTSDELRVLFDKAFQEAVNKKETRPGVSLDKGLRAVYDKGVQDGVKRS